MKIYIKLIGLTGERKHTLMAKLEAFLRGEMELEAINPSTGLRIDVPYTLKSWDATWKVLP